MSDSPSLMSKHKTILAAGSLCITLVFVKDCVFKRLSLPVKDNSFPKLKHKWYHQGIWRTRRNFDSHIWYYSSTEVEHFALLLWVMVQPFSQLLSCFSSSSSHCNGTYMCAVLQLTFSHMGFVGHSTTPKQSNLHRGISSDIHSVESHSVYYSSMAVELFPRLPCPGNDVWRWIPSFEFDDVLI